MTPDFHPHPLLRGPHAQTLYPFVVRARRRPHWAPERLELPDGDFVDLGHLGAGDGPRVCLFHGLEGHIDSHYIGGLARALVARGLRVTLMHFRGCSGTPNRLARTYHSGDTGDIAHLLDTLRTREPPVPLTAVGFSLGANALLKYLGERGRAHPLAAAVAISPPLRLAVAATRIEQGFSRLYQAYLLRRMKQTVHRLARALGGLPIDLRRMDRSRSFREFDDCATAPLHGFRDVDDYYSRSSAAAWLAGIETPTLVIHARDDPFVGPEGVRGLRASGPGVQLAISEYGGHVGFMAPGRLGLPVRWLERRVPDWLSGEIEWVARTPGPRAAIGPVLSD